MKWTAISEEKALGKKTFSKEPHLQSALCPKKDCKHFSFLQMNFWSWSENNWLFTILPLTITESWDCCYGNVLWTMHLCGRRSPAMACGSEEYSCTSRTPQSRDAFSFFSLEADGATLKRPYSPHTGNTWCVIIISNTSEQEHNADFEYFH